MSEVKIKPASLKGANVRRRIVWNNVGTGTESGTAVVLVGYCPDTLPYFMAMAQEVLQAFPKADPNQMICAKVSRSNYIQGYTLLLAPVKGPKREVKDWEEGSIDFNY